MSIKITPRFFSFAILLALLYAYFVQIYLHITPCTYCIYQRYIFVAAMVFFYIRKLEKFGFYLLMVGFFLSGYHIGLEHHYWSDLLQKCHTHLPQLSSAIELKGFLKAAPLTHCDQVNWRIFGISATVWIALFQAALMILYRIARRS